MKLSWITLALTLSTGSQAYLAWHWHEPGTQTPVQVDSGYYGGDVSRFTLSGAACIITDPWGNAFNSTTSPNTATSGQAICRMAKKYLVSGGCSVGANNLYVCTGEVNPASCTIVDGYQVTCN